MPLYFECKIMINYTSFPVLDKHLRGGWYSSSDNHPRGVHNVASRTIFTSLSKRFSCVTIRPIPAKSGVSTPVFGLDSASGEVSVQDPAVLCP